MKRLLGLMFVTLSLVLTAVMPSTVSVKVVPSVIALPRQDCNACADSARVAGAIAYNALRDAGETDETVLACAYSLAKINYGYQNCGGCSWIAMAIESSPCEN